MRHEPMAYLPALLALALAAFSLPARAQTQLITLCSGGSLPGTPMPRNQDCDSACHVGCTARKKSGRLG
jgi:hypothetical protein